MAVALSEGRASAEQEARAFLCAAVTIEWDPTVWVDALLSVRDADLILPLLLTARRMTGGAVFETLASVARERGLDEMLERLPELIDALPPERDDAVIVRGIAGDEVEHMRIPSRTSVRPTGTTAPGTPGCARPVRARGVIVSSAMASAPDRRSGKRAADMPRYDRPQRCSDECQVPDTPRTWNLEQAGSRFTTRAALAVLTRSYGASRYPEGEEAGSADDVIADALGGPPSGVRGLGEARAVDAFYGRGAAGWVPVVEWTMQAVVGGVIGNVAWDALKRGARELRELTEPLRERQVDFLVSRGTAALLAIDHLLRSGHETAILDVEAVEEPSALKGGPPLELNFVGIEPWLVSLVNASRSARYIVAISPSGQIGGVLRLAVGEIERHYLRIPDRHEADEAPEPAQLTDAMPDDEEPAEALHGDDLDGISPRDEVEFGLDEIVEGARSVGRGLRRGITRRIRRRRRDLRSSRKS